MCLGRILLREQLPLHDEARISKIDQFINNLRRAQRIRNIGGRTQPQWVNTHAAPTLAPARKPSGRILTTATTATSALATAATLAKA